MKSLEGTNRKEGKNKQKVGVKEALEKREESRQE